MRKYAVGSFVGCSPRHHHCSPAHGALVAGYRDERYRQELTWEGDTGAYAGDHRHWVEKGGSLVTFKDWLIANKGSGREKKKWEDSNV